MFLYSGYEPDPNWVPSLPNSMKSTFGHGTIMEIWQGTIEMEKWFDPAFQEVIDKELIPRTLKNKRS